MVLLTFLGFWRWRRCMMQHRPLVMSHSPEDSQSSLYCLRPADGGRQTCISPVDHENILATLPPFFYFYAWTCQSISTSAGWKEEQNSRVVISILTAYTDNAITQRGDPHYGGLLKCCRIIGILLPWVLLHIIFL